MENAVARRSRQDFQPCDKISGMCSAHLDTRNLAMVVTLASVSAQGTS